MRKRHCVAKRCYGKDLQRIGKAVTSHAEEMLINDLLWNSYDQKREGFALCFFDWRKNRIEMNSLAKELRRNDASSKGAAWICEAEHRNCIDVPGNGDEARGISFDWNGIAAAAC